MHAKEITSFKGAFVVRKFAALLSVEEFFFIGEEEQNIWIVVYETVKCTTHSITWDSCNKKSEIQILIIVLSSHINLLRLFNVMIFVKNCKLYLENLAFCILLSGKRKVHIIEKRKKQNTVNEHNVCNLLFVSYLFVYMYLFCRHHVDKKSIVVEDDYSGY